VGATIYSLCALAAALCAYRLLLWSGLCFAGLAINNALLVLDKVILPDVDLAVPRTLVALLAMMILLYGLIWDTE
jgi:hypothetical protein